MEGEGAPRLLERLRVRRAWRLRVGRALRRHARRCGCWRRRAAAREWRWRLDGGRDTEVEREGLRRPHRVRALAHAAVARGARARTGYPWQCTAAATRGSVRWAARRQRGGSAAAARRARRARSGLGGSPLSHLEALEVEHEHARQLRDAVAHGRALLAARLAAHLQLVVGKESLEQLRGRRWWAAREGAAVQRCR
eukprot:6387630-Prymnesium_polylepis.2